MLEDECDSLMCAVGILCSRRVNLPTPINQYYLIDNPGSGFLCERVSGLLKVVTRAIVKGIINGRDTHTGPHTPMAE